MAAINDVSSGEMIGNFPQAFSYIGLVNAAWANTQARQRAAQPDGPLGRAARIDQHAAVPLT